MPIDLAKFKKKPQFEPKRFDLQEESEILKTRKESKYEKTDKVLPDSDTLRKFCRDLGFRGKNLRLGNRGHTKLIIKYLTKILQYL